MTSRRASPSLPPFVPPMLARPGAPFDSDTHLFEIKWDGTRMLAFVERDEVWLHAGFSPLQTSNGENSR